MQEITEIAELKEIQLGILRKVDELCKAHHLKYFMTGIFLIHNLL